MTPGGLPKLRAITSAELVRSSDHAQVKDTWQIGSGVELSCKPQSVSLVALDRCVYCEEKDVIVGYSAASIGTRLSVECPGDTHVGNVTGHCGQRGWTTISGACVRKSCPSAQSDLAAHVWAFLTTGDDETFPPWPELDDVDFREFWSAASGEAPMLLPHYDGLTMIVAASLLQGNGPIPTSLAAH